MAGLAATALAAGLSLAVTPASPASAGAAQPSDGTPATVEQQVWDELAAEGATDFWIHLREQADLGGAESIADWDQRGQFVYDRLTQTAETS
ncbi:MAG: hypothetical protein GEV12_22465, partial [Micromonosporaceae bacterium]|nr:hypothetical protein [Micromonosporaceae bacterium]